MCDHFFVRVNHTTPDSCNKCGVIFMKYMIIKIRENITLSKGKGNGGTGDIDHIHLWNWISTDNRYICVNTVIDAEATAYVEQQGHINMIVNKQCGEILKNKLYE